MLAVGCPCSVCCRLLIFFDNIFPFVKCFKRHMVYDLYEYSFCCLHELGLNLEWCAHWGFRFKWMKVACYTQIAQRFGIEACTPIADIKQLWKAFWNNKFYYFKPIVYQWYTQWSVLSLGASIYNMVCSALFLQRALYTVHCTNIMHSRTPSFVITPAVFS